MVELLGENPIILFGGSFNPPTIGHALACQLLLESFPTIPIWVVPSGDRRDKTISTEYSHRFEMCKEMIEEYFQSQNIKAISIENEYPAPTSTFSTLNILQKQFGFYHWLVYLQTRQAKCCIQLCQFI